MLLRASRLVWFALVALGATAVPARAQAVDPKTAFERMKALAGTWEGRGGHGQTDQDVRVVYRVASGGSVVQETQFPGSPHEMISMYHLADGQLVLTHYCAMGNQPKMKLDTKASTAERLVFAFDGGTNFDPAKDGHVHSGVLEWKGAGLNADWSSWAGGREQGHILFVLSRQP